MHVQNREKKFFICMTHHNGRLGYTDSVLEKCSTVIMEIFSKRLWFSVFIASIRLLSNALVVLAQDSQQEKSHIFRISTKEVSNIVLNKQLCECLHHFFSTTCRCLFDRLNHHDWIFTPL